MSELSSSLESVNVEDVDPNTMMIGIMESQNDIRETIAQLLSTNNRYEDIETSIERLEAISDSIKKYGICRATMEASDPDRELVSSGICCAYEDLSDVPTKDSVAVDVVNGIDLSMTSSLEKLNVVKEIVAPFVVGFVVTAASLYATSLLFDKLEFSVGDVSNRFSRSLAKADKKLMEHTKFNEDKFGDSITNTLSKNDFYRLIKAGRIVVKAIDSDEMQKLAKQVLHLLESGSVTPEHVDAAERNAESFYKNVVANADVASTLGLSLQLNGHGGFGYASSSKPILLSFGSMRSHGWRTGDVHPAVKDAISFLNDCMGAAAHIKNASKTCKEVASALKRLKSKASSFEEEATYKRALQVLKSIIKTNHTLLIRETHAFGIIGLSATNLCSKAMSARTDKWYHRK